jgi:alcohol dehydrogenase class IV
VTAFAWHDGERVIHFGRGSAADAVSLLGGPGYALLTTPRGAAALPAVVEAAAAVHEVPGGLVDELAGDLLDVVAEDRVVALGGGRVIDTAKAIVAARGGRAMAIPTTLSAAEMTVVHRRARGAPDQTGFVRPAVVINDPALSASQPDAELAASTLNAMSHALEGPLTTRSHPVARLTGDEAVRLLLSRDRDEIALGALLAGSVIDSTGYGLHHVLAQTLVRVGGAEHAFANAVLLPHTLRALGLDPTPAEQVLPRTGVSRISEIGVERERLAACADAAAERGELDLTPPRRSRDELLAIYDAAW